MLYVVMSMAAMSFLVFSLCGFSQSHCDVSMVYVPHGLQGYWMSSWVQTEQSVCSESLEAKETNENGSGAFCFLLHFLGDGIGMPL